MFAIERHNKIKEKLFKEKRVDVVELSEMFSVTEVTIRRDLDKLEQEGFLIKTYGGAVLSNEFAAKALKFEPSDNAFDEKRLIGKIASQMLDNGEAIFLGSGTTCLEIARNIKDKKLTVVTNDLLIGYELRNHAGIKIIVTGGDLIQATSTLVGAFALQALNGIYINKAFTEVKGINFDSCYTVDSHDEAILLQEVKRRSNELIIVADYTKFDRTAFVRLGDLTMAKKVISNKQVPSEYKKYFFEHAIKLYTTFEFD